MKAPFTFLASTTMFVLWYGDVSIEAAKAIDLENGRGNQSNKRRGILSTSSTRRQGSTPIAAKVQEPPGLFADSGGLELNPDYVKPTSRGATSLHRSRRTNNHRGGAGGDASDFFLNEQQIESDFFSNDNQQLGNVPSRPSPLSFSWQRQAPPITESLKTFFRNMLLQSPVSFWTTLACLAVFVLWQIVPSAYWLYTYFVCTRQSTIQSYGLPILLSNVSHQTFRHLAVSLLAFCHLAPKVWKQSKKTVFTAGMTDTVTLSSATATTAATPLWPLLLGSSVLSHTIFVLVRKHKACMGLGGIVMTLVGYYYGGVVPPNQQLNFLIWGILPVSIRARLLVQLVFGVSLVGSFSTRSTISHLVHLTGLIFGLVCYHGWEKVAGFVNPWDHAKKLHRTFASLGNRRR